MFNPQDIASVLKEIIHLRTIPNQGPKRTQPHANGVNGAMLDEKDIKVEVEETVELAETKVHSATRDEPKAPKMDLNEFRQAFYGYPDIEQIIDIMDRCIKSGNMPDKKEMKLMEGLLQKAKDCYNLYNRSSKRISRIIDYVEQMEKYRISSKSQQKKQSSKASEKLKKYKISPKSQRENQSSMASSSKISSKTQQENQSSPASSSQMQPMWNLSPEMIIASQNLHAQFLKLQGNATATQHNSVNQMIPSALSDTPPGIENPALPAVPFNFPQHEFMQNQAPQQQARPVLQNPAESQILPNGVQPLDLSIQNRATWPTSGQVVENQGYAEMFAKNQEVMRNMQRQ